MRGAISAVRLNRGQDNLQNCPKREPIRGENDPTEVVQACGVADEGSAGHAREIPGGRAAS